MPSNETTGPEGYAKQLDRMKGERIFSIEQDGNHFWVEERCDGHFAERLTREELIQLGTEILEMANGT